MRTGEEVFEGYENSSARERGLRAERVDDGRWYGPAPGHVVDGRQQREGAAPAALIQQIADELRRVPVRQLHAVEELLFQARPLRGGRLADRIVREGLGQDAPAARGRRQHEIAEPTRRLEERRP